LLVGTAAVVDVVTWSSDGELRGGGTLPLWVIPTLTALVYATLFARRRYPLPVFAVQWVYALAGLFVPGFQPFAGLLIALYAIARRGSDRPAIAALMACAVPFGIDSYNTGSLAAHGSQLANVTTSALLWTALTLLVWGLARLAYTGDRRAEQLREKQAAEAVQAERLRLARDLHDVVSHSVSAMILQAAGARTLIPRDLEQARLEQVRNALEVIESVGVQAMGEMHRLLGLLRATDPASPPDALGEPPRSDAIDELVLVARASGVDVETVVDGVPAHLDPSVDATAYRIVQEALTNTVKHAGRGAAAHIHLLWEADRLTLSVRDRGGLPPTDRRTELSFGYGLTGLRERVALVGGSLTYGPVSGGFLVRAELPASAVPPRPGPLTTSARDRT